jgi:hypothetical protein
MIIAQRLCGGIRLARVEYYLRNKGHTTGQLHEPFQTWEVGPTKAILLGVANPEDGIGSCFKALPGEEIFAAIHRQATGWFGPNGETPFYKLDQAPLTFYLRIARPIQSFAWRAVANPGAKWDVDAAMGVSQLAVLTPATRSHLPNGSPS